MPPKTQTWNPALDVQTRKTNPGLEKNLDLQTLVVRSNGVFLSLNMLIISQQSLDDFAMVYAFV